MTTLSATVRQPIVTVLALVAGCGALVFAGAQSLGIGQHRLGVGEICVGVGMFVAASLVRGR